MLPIERLKLLEKFFVPKQQHLSSALTQSYSSVGSSNANNNNKFSIETLLDTLIVLYDECCNSSLRRDKMISNFIEYCEYLLEFIFI